MTWTVFTDLRSGGTLKAKWPVIAIELPMAKAMQTFENTLHVDPTNKSCECCSHDYHIGRHADILQATGAVRSAKYKGGKYIEEPLKGRTLGTVAWLRDNDLVLFIGETDIDTKHLVSYIAEDEYDD